MSIQCPKCGSDASSVVDSRTWSPGQRERFRYGAEGIRRRRECGNCGERFTTHEMIAGSWVDESLQEKANKWDGLIESLRESTMASTDELEGK